MVVGCCRSCEEEEQLESVGAESEVVLKGDCDEEEHEEVLEDNFETEENKGEASDER